MGSSSSIRSGVDRERQRERGALALAARNRGRRGIGIHREALQEFVEPRFARPQRAVVVHVREIAAQHQRLAQRLGGRQHRLLLDARDGQARPALHFAGIERNLSEQRAQQRRLAGAVAADEPDAIAGLDGDRSAIEQRMQAEREFRVLEGDQCHGGSTTDWRVRARSIRWRP